MDIFKSKSDKGSGKKKLYKKKGQKSDRLKGNRKSLSNLKSIKGMVKSPLSKSPNKLVNKKGQTSYQKKNEKTLKTQKSRMKLMKLQMRSKTEIQEDIELSGKSKKKPFKSILAVASKKSNTKLYINLSKSTTFDGGSNNASVSSRTNKQLLIQKKSIRATGKKSNLKLVKGIGKAQPSLTKFKLNLNNRDDCLRLMKLLQKRITPWTETADQQHPAPKKRLKRKKFHKMKAQKKMEVPVSEAKPETPTIGDDKENRTAVKSNEEMLKSQIPKIDATDEEGSQIPKEFVKVLKSSEDVIPPIKEIKAIKESPDGSIIDEEVKEKAVKSNEEAAKERPYKEEGDDGEKDNKDDGTAKTTEDETVNTAEGLEPDELEDLNDELLFIYKDSNTLYHSYGQILTSLMNMQQRRQRKGQMVPVAKTGPPMFTEIQDPMIQNRDFVQMMMSKKDTNYAVKYAVELFQKEENVSDTTFKELFREIEDIYSAGESFRACFDREGYIHMNEYVRRKFKITRTQYDVIFSVAKRLREQVNKILEAYSGALLDMFRLTDSDIGLTVNTADDKSKSQLKAIPTATEVKTGDGTCLPAAEKIAEPVPKESDETPPPDQA